MKFEVRINERYSYPSFPMRSDELLTRPELLPDNIRASLIEANLNSKEAFVLSPEGVTTRKATWLRDIKEAYTKTYHEKGWQSVAITICKIAIASGLCLGILGGIIYLTVIQIGNLRGDIGQYFNYYRDGFLHKYRVLYTKEDFYKDCAIELFLRGVLTFMMELPVIFFGFEIISHDPLIQNFNQLRKNPIVVTTTTTKVDSSMANIALEKLANGKDPETDEYRDPITLEGIPVDEIGSPKILSIGKYALPLNTALKAIFSKASSCASGEIPHPIYGGTLTGEEKDKFLTDVSQFLCTSKESLEKCWAISDEEYEQYVEFIAKRIYAGRWSSFHAATKGACRNHLRDQLKPAFVIKKFEAIIPSGVRSYFNDALRYEYTYLIVEASEAPVVMAPFGPVFT